MKQQRLAVLGVGTAILLLMTFYTRFWIGFLFVLPLGFLIWKELGFKVPKFPAKETPKAPVARPVTTRPMAMPAAHTFRTQPGVLAYAKELELLQGTPGEVPLTFSVTRGKSTFSVKNILDMTTRYIAEGSGDYETLNNIRMIYRMLVNEYQQVPVYK